MDRGWIDPSGLLATAFALLWTVVSLPGIPGAMAATPMASPSSDESGMKINVIHELHVRTGAGTEIIRLRPGEQPTRVSPDELADPKAEQIRWTLEVSTDGSGRLVFRAPKAGGDTPLLAVHPDGAIQLSPHLAFTGRNVEGVRELQFFDANRDGHVFEIEELPGGAGSARVGTLQISPVVGEADSHDTDYVLIHPKTGAIDFKGPGSKRFHGSAVSDVGEINLADNGKDGRTFRLHEFQQAKGPFRGILRLMVEGEGPGDTTALIVHPHHGWVGVPNDLIVRGHLGAEGIPVTLGEPLEVNGQRVRGLAADPCATCAVRLDYFDENEDGKVDAAETVGSLEQTVGCQSGQLCSTMREVRVPGGETQRIEFERSFASGLPQLAVNPTFRPAESEDRVPVFTIESVTRNERGHITGVVVRNGDADTAHSAVVGIQGVVP